MSFFNKKEEVIDLQLTQFGKQLLSQGKFKPFYYSFFDNNVLYDSAYSGLVQENSIDIEDRIQEETPYNKTQYVFSSRETAISSFSETNRTRLANQPESSVLSFANPAEAAYSQLLPLGNSELGNQKSPNFSVVFLNGELSGSVETAYSSSYNVQKIPQLNANITYTVKPIDIATITNFATNQNIKYVGSFSDSTTFKVTQEYLLLQILENNVDFEKENFDIFAFLVETVSSGTTADAISSSYEQLVPLPFSDDLLPKTSEFIDHYLQISYDEQIPTNLVCESVKRMKKLDYLLDDDYECDDLNQVLPISIYQSNIVDEDIENCDV